MTSQEQVPMTGPVEFETLLVETTHDRCVVTLNRPEARNAISHAMVDELHRVCEALERRPRILLLQGAAGCFASGADISELMERGREDALRGINSAIFARIAALPLPVVAAVDGYALGGGAELAYAADIRLGTPRVRIGQPEAGLGILAAAGGSWRLRELVGEPLAKELLLTGRVLDGNESLAARLVSSLHEPDELHGAAMTLIDRMAELDPLALRLTKLAFEAPRGAHPAIDGIAQAVLFESPEKHRRMQDFLDRRGRR